MNNPRVTITGQPLTTLGDEALLQLILRQDLPRALTTMYAAEVDRRLQQPLGQLELAI